MTHHPGIIIKVLKPPAGQRAGSFAASIRYARGMAHDFDRDRVDPDAPARAGMRGEVISMHGVTSINEAARQMDAIASRSRAIDSVIHIVFSSQRMIDAAEARRVEAEALAAIGITDDYQRVSFGHGDTDAYHWHCIANRTSLVTLRPKHMSHAIRKLECAATEINYRRGWKIHPGKHNNGLVKRLALEARNQIRRHGRATIPADELARYDNAIRADAARLTRNEGSIPQSAIVAAQSTGEIPVATIITDIVHRAYREETTLVAMRDRLARQGIAMRCTVKTGKGETRYPAVSFGMGDDGPGTSGSSIGLKAAMLEAKYGPVDQPMPPISVKQMEIETPDTRRNRKLRDEYEDYLAAIKDAQAKHYQIARANPRAKHVNKMREQRAAINAWKRAERAKAITAHTRGSHDRSLAYATIEEQARRLRAQLRAEGKRAWLETRKAILADQPKAMLYAAWLRSLPPSSLRDAEIEMVTAKRHLPKKRQLPKPKVPEQVIESPHKTEIIPTVTTAPEKIIETQKPEAYDLVDALHRAALIGGDAIEAAGLDAMQRGHPVVTVREIASILASTDGDIAKRLRIARDVAAGAGRKDAERAEAVREAAAKSAARGQRPPGGVKPAEKGDRGRE